MMVVCSRILWLYKRKNCHCFVNKSLNKWVRSPQKEPKVAKPSNEIYSLECKQIDLGYGGPIFIF